MFGPPLGRPLWRYLPPRINVRTMIILVLAFGGGLGWLARTDRLAREQQSIVAALRNAGGIVLYNIPMRETRLPNGEIQGEENSGWPRWIRSRVAPDYFFCVGEVYFNLPRPGIFGGATDELLSGVRRFDGLGALRIHGPGVTDAGFAELEHLKKIRFLSLNETRVTDEGLKHLRGMTTLRGLRLVGTSVTDAGLAHLKGMTRLEKLDLDGTHVTDAGIAHLKGMENLRELSLDSTQITDAGLTQLKGLKRLRYLYLSGTGVTAEGARGLKDNLPGLTVHR
jgi:internalin A